MKTRGNLIIDEIIITPAGVSVGGYADRRMLREAKQKAARMTLSARTSTLTIVTPANKPPRMGNIDTETPKMKEERTSPRKMAQRLIGDETNRSRVLARAPRTGFEELPLV